MQVKERSFEDALGRLEEVVKKLEDGRLPLEEALELFAEGIELTNICKDKLDGAEQRISILTTNQQGQPELKDVRDKIIGGG